MPVFLTLNDTNIFDPAFWAAQNINADSTINATSVSDSIQITLTGNAITFTDTSTNTSTTFTNADLGGGSFSQIVEFRGNDADNIIGGSVGLNAQGYIGGSGNDSLTDDGADGGQLLGGRGDDTLTGGVGNNEIDGGNGDDLLIGGSGNNNLQGGNGNDTLIGGMGSGNLIGGNGADLIVASPFTTFVDGGNGPNSMVIPEGSTFTPFSPGSSGGTVFVTLDDGSTRQFTYLNIASDNITVACFAEGTRIATPRGQVPVETLGVGDDIVTMENGTQRLRWVGRTKVAGDGRYAPICFDTHSIGNERPLYLSPQHRVLLDDWTCEMLFGARPVLCAAKHLVNGGQIYRAPRPQMTYFHLMFDAHQIIFAEGAATESLFVGDHQLDADPTLYEELFSLFPELKDAAHPARQIAHRPLRAFEAQALRDAQAELVGP